MSTLPRLVDENSLLRPVSLTPKQQELCKRLNEFYGSCGVRRALDPSEMFKGALIAVERSDGNPDWVSQAANSLREIIYPLWSRPSNDVPQKADALENYGSVHTNEAKEKIDEIYRDLNNLTHHSDTMPKMSKSDFEELIAKFERIMLNALTRTTDLQRKISELASSEL